MFVTYFDEVKPNPKQGMHHYFIGGICLPLEKIDEVEKQTNELATEIFGKGDLTNETEFHGSQIYFGKGSFKGIPPADRIDILRRLAGIISGNREFVNLIFSSIDTTKYTRSDVAKTAFMLR